MESTFILGGVIEMHLILQKRVFEIAYIENCIPLEVFPDDCTNGNDYSIMFILRNYRA